MFNKALFAAANEALALHEPIHVERRAADKRRKQERREARGIKLDMRQAWETTESDSD